MNAALLAVALTIATSLASCGGASDPAPRTPTDSAQEKPSSTALGSQSTLQRNTEQEKPAAVRASSAGRREVRTAGGAIVILPPKPTSEAVPPAHGCRMRRIQADGVERVVGFPPRPGIRAVRLNTENVRIAYRFGRLQPDCRPAVLQVILDENDTPSAGDLTVAQVRASEGTLTISVPEDLREADVVRAIARTKNGLPSDAAAALIR